MSHKKTVFAISVLLGVVFWAGAASAENKADGEHEKDSERAYGRFYNGSFVEYSVRGALARPTSTAYDGFSIDTGLRQSFPMLIGDTRLSYRFDSLFDESTPTRNQVERHSLGLHLGVHPLYLFLIESDWWGYTLASLYLEIGGGVQYGVLDTGSDIDDDFGFFGTVGAGVDIPLWDPDTGKAPWLNVLYRYGGGRMQLQRKGGRALERMHSVIAGIGWRYNGLLF